MSFSAEDILNRMITRLRQKNEWKDILETSAVNLLLSPISEELSYLASFDTYLTRENKWDLARNRTSLLGFDGIHRYNAHRKIGAEGVLTLSADQTFNVAPTVNIDIPKYTQFSTDGGIIFVSKEAYVITTADTSIDIDAIQGTPRTTTFIGVGEDFEEFILNNENIENSFYELSVNGVSYTKVENIFEWGSTDKVYELTNKIDFSGIYIKFGNNINGKKLESGDIIVFKYIETEGFDGNISTSNTVTNVDSTILNIDGATVDIFVKNDDSMVGGQNLETLEEIRANAPQFFQTGDRASSKSDYRIIVLTNFSYILKATVWGTYETNIDDGNNPWVTVPLEENSVFLSTIRTDLSESLTTAQKLEISEALNEYKAPTDIVEFVDGQIVNIIFTINAFVSNRSFTLTQVKSNIDTQLQTLYNLENREFFEHIRASDYISAIDSTSGVDYHTTSVQLYEDYSFTNVWTVSLALPLFPVTPSTITIKVKDTVNDTAEVTLGTDNGSGIITGSGIFAGLLTGSTITYSTGIGSLILDNIPPVLTQPYTNYRVRVFYSIDANDLVLKERNQIFNYDDTLSLPNITTTYTS